jgi:hypothetical protein
VYADRVPDEDALDEGAVDAVVDVLDGDAVTWDAGLAAMAGAMDSTSPARVDAATGGSGLMSPEVRRARALAHEESENVTRQMPCWVSSRVSAAE